jgi:hypothetical protein
MKGCLIWWLISAILLFRSIAIGRATTQNNDKSINSRFDALFYRFVAT